MTKGKGRPRGWRGGKYAPRRRVCSFCTGKIKEIDYKDSAMLGGYISDRGKIEPRRRTGTCAKHQRALAVAIKRARHLALLPFAPEHIYRMGHVTNIAFPGLRPEKAAEPEAVEIPKTDVKAEVAATTEAAEPAETEEKAEATEDAEPAAEAEETQAA
jgi:small subunit ribosomal protein S18